MEARLEMTHLFYPLHDVHPTQFIISLSVP
jgi:hypothetical protein